MSKDLVAGKGMKETNPSLATSPHRSAPACRVDLGDPIQAALCLALTPGVGPRLYRMLVAALGSPDRVLQAAPSTLRELPGIGSRLASSIAAAATDVDIGDELRLCREHKIELVGVDHPDYPTRLSEIGDAPAVLWCRGDLLPRDDLAIAIVGTRHATRYGLRQAERLARGLALTGYTIVSGLARGIDAAAHRGALSAGGRTLAVLGSGLLNMYPPEHGELSLQIAADGAVISEFPALQPPRSGAFPQRNRIISGLSLGVIIVEAAERSGALISARHAMEQNREVFAVPGPIDSRVSAGCHQLIRDGATLVQGIDDVIEQLGPLARPVARTAGQQIHHPAELQLNPQETSVLQAVTEEPTAVDVIVANCGLPVHRVLSTLSVLEMRRLVRRVSGSEFCRR
jgi:DNA processing protein